MVRESSSESPATLSLLSRLRPPQPSDLARKRRITCNPPEAADDVVTTVDVVLWWKGHEHELPHWDGAFTLIALVQPSSGACEHVFSLLTNAFS